MVQKLNKVLYTAEATAVGGRSGHARSSDGVVDVDLAPPVSMGGPGGATNPEELFATGYAACFQSALAAVARRRKVDTGDSRVTAKVSIGVLPGTGGGYGLAVALDVHLPGVDRALAEELVEAAHKVCPYSNATRGNIDVTLSVV